MCRKIVYNGKSKGQHFGMLQNAFVRIVDKENRRATKSNLKFKTNQYEIF